MKIDPKYIRRILVIRIGGIGDVVTATPALRALRNRFPNAHISLMVTAPGEQIISGSPWVDEFIIYSELYRSQNIFKIITTPHLLSQLFQLSKRLFFGRFDMLVAFHSLYGLKYTFKPLLVTLFARPRIRAGVYEKNLPGLGFFLNIKTPEDFLEFKHYTKRFLELIEALGGDGSDQKTEVWVEENDKKFAREFFKEKGVSDDTVLIGIHPSGNPYAPIRTTWPSERFRELADILNEKYGARIIITGSKKDVSLVNSISSSMKIPPLTLTNASIKQFACVLKRCNLFIGNDSGPMHIAVAMGVPTIGIFGSTDWNMNGSYSSDTNFILLRKPIDCWPCQDLKCTTRACMNLVTVDDVLKAVEKQMEKIK
jgi:heptosyltransferase-2